MNGPCLVRIDFLNVARCNALFNPTVIYLNKSKVTVGRSRFAEYRFLCTIVGGEHVTIESGANSNEWLCTSWSRETFVNGSRVRNGVQFGINNGDVIRFGLEMIEPINVFVCRLTTMNHSCEERTEGSYEDLRRRNRQLEAEIERMKLEIRDKEVQLIACDEEVEDMREELRSTKEKAAKLEESLNRNDQDRIAEEKKLEAALQHSSSASEALQELLGARNRTVSYSSENSNDLKTTLINVLETELKCGVCTDLIVEAATLECHHTFCSYCIREWCRRKNECPICREPVVCFTKAIVLDCFVDKALDLLSPELKAQRLETIAERRQSCEMVQRGATAASYNSEPRYSRMSHLEHDDDMHFGFEDHELSESFDHRRFILIGPPRFRYDSCFCCGQQGHWANHCPYR